MTMPITYKGQNYYITDTKTLNLYDHFFVNFLFIQNVCYKKYLISGDRYLLIKK